MRKTSHEYKVIQARAFFQQAQDALRPTTDPVLLSLMVAVDYLIEAEESTYGR